jgi:hypothetical protein
LTGKRSGYYSNLPFFLLLFFPQLVPTLLVNLAAISSGLSLGYSAIALPQLKPYMDSANVHDATFGHNIEHYRPFIVDEEQGSWIGKRFAMRHFAGFPFYVFHRIASNTFFPGNESFRGLVKFAFLKKVVSERI